MRLELDLPDSLVFVSLQFTQRTGLYRLVLGARDPMAWPDLMCVSREGTDLPVLASELTRDAADSVDTLLRERAAARSAAAGARNAPPDQRYPPPLQRAPAAAAGSAAGSLPLGRPATAAPGGPPPIVTGWTDSVPRQAAEWHRASDGSVRVVLRPGLYYADGATERTFPTVRRAKDDTRAATRGYQEGLL